MNRLLPISILIALLLLMSASHASAQQPGDYGDAPEGVIAYPATGVIGNFPTCTGVGYPNSFVSHASSGNLFLGPTVDTEFSDGNGGWCPNFPPYDADECWNDGDSGLLGPGSYTIDNTFNVVPCQPGAAMHALGGPCSTVYWGPNLDLQITNNTGAPAYLNVLMDWNQDGQWNGQIQCWSGPVPEHALANFMIPPGFSGPVSSIFPPSITTGPNEGYIWTRFTLSDMPVIDNWDGSGSFPDGETSDFLLRVALEPQTPRDFGDAPEGSLAYPTTGVIGNFPTCATIGPVGSFIYHSSVSLQLFLGPGIDLELDGNAGICPNFPPYDADECRGDGDAGLIMPGSYTIDASLSVVPCPQSPLTPLGVPCTPAAWGQNVDIQVSNLLPAPAYLNVLMDWNQDGQWAGQYQCGGSYAAEHVLVNFPVPPGFVGPASGLNLPRFVIGPRGGYVWTRFTVSDQPVPMDWNGNGTFQDGETSDYLLRVEGDFGDAPEGVIAYPATGMFGQFPTCMSVGPSGFVSHRSSGTMMLGPRVDLEADGNAGFCPVFPPYDSDECWGDGDAGLIMPGSYRIDEGMNVVPCPQSPATSLGSSCGMVTWGVNLDLQVVNSSPQQAFLNVLFDWNQDGLWSGQSDCQGWPVPEHVLANLPVPPGFSGPASALAPPGFMIGPNAGYVWSRFTLSDVPVATGWDGSGSFGDGETSDYLIRIDLPPPPPVQDFGDAPEGTVAYPSPTPVVGNFPTCMTVGPAGYIAHTNSGNLFLGPTVDLEDDGNGGVCPDFLPFDADECWNDGDAGLIGPSAFTRDPGGTAQPCPGAPGTALGVTCTWATWGQDIDLQVVNNTPGMAFVNVLIDWDRDGMWGGYSQCPIYGVPEHILQNFVVPPGFNGSLSALMPPGFWIGPKAYYHWSRFSITPDPVPGGWDGSGIFSDGETSDYLLRVDAPVTGVEDPNGPITVTRLLPAQPNPFNMATSISFELPRDTSVDIGVFDVAGRRIRTLADREESAGRHHVIWNGRNDDGGQAASGIYFIRLTSEGTSQTSPVVLLK